MAVRLILTNSRKAICLQTLEELAWLAARMRVTLNSTSAADALLPAKLSMHAHTPQSTMCAMVVGAEEQIEGTAMLCLETLDSSKRKQHSTN